MKSKRHSLTLALAIFLCATGGPNQFESHAEPATSRTLLSATADGSQNRILIRWDEIDGQPRFSYFDLLRREATATAFATLNLDPLGPFRNVAQVEAFFTAPGHEDALTSIIGTLGSDYSMKLLAFANGPQTGNEGLQKLMLPDVNYGAAIALGRGYLDESVTAGTTYVYELWGLDERGFRVERIGTVQAKAGSAAALPALEEIACAKVGGVQADRAAFLRIKAAASTSDRRLAGYDVFRAPKNQDGSCPSVTPGSAGVVQVNRFPVLGKAPGNPSRGQTLFEARCTSCHAGGRDVAPVAGSTRQQFERRMFPALWPNAGDAAHDRSELHALASDDLDQIYDYLHEFQFRDDGSATPSAPLEVNREYCYQLVPRDLLGRRGPGAATPPICRIEDRVAPRVPTGLRVTRVLANPTTERCEIAWDRNADDTGKYEILRRADDAPRTSAQDPTSAHSAVTQPASGLRVSYQDTTQSSANAGRAFFYAVRAVDGNSNTSALSGWIPCTPRDIVAPGAATLSNACARQPDGKACKSCGNLGADNDWTSKGGDPNFWVYDAGECGAGFTVTASGDPFVYRVERSFDGIDFQPADDQTSPLTVNFAPMIDQVLHVRVRAIDKSGNIGPVSNTLKAYPQAPPLPAPQIVSIGLLDADTGQVKIKFRSLPPSAVLGFVLYRDHLDGDDQFQEVGGELVYKESPANLGARYDAERFLVKPGAQPIGNLIRTDCTDLINDETLCYSDLDQLYVMKATLETATNIVLRLRAVSMSGRQGQTNPQYWDGFDMGDRALDWPQFRRDSSPDESGIGGLSGSILSSPQRIQLTWSAKPDGCNAGSSRPFVVLRQRGNGTWQQHSQPFICEPFAANPESMLFIDTDVQSGFTYNYRVVRLNELGEFQIRLGTTTVIVP